MLLAPLCHKLDQMFKKIWWGFPSKKARNLSLKSWDSHCLPKSQGGLGFRKMKDVNLALISKLGWKLHTGSDSMWVSQLTGKYLLFGSFLLCPHPSPPPQFLSFLALERHPSLQQTISQGACHRVHSQSPLSVWNFPWIPTIPSFTPSSSPNLNPPDLVVSDLISPNAAWNLPLLISPFDPSSVREIQKVKIHSHPKIDLWTPTPNGIFSSSSAYKLICSLRVSSSSRFDCKSWNLPWKLNLNVRLKLFL